MSEALEVEVKGERVELTEDEAREILRSLHRQFSERSRAQEAAAREAGQVWYALYWRYGTQHDEECFSLAEAASYLDGGDEYGNHSSDSIRCPDGTVYTREDRVDEWANLPALKGAS